MHAVLTDWEMDGDVHTVGGWIDLPLARRALGQGTARAPELLTVPLLANVAVPELPCGPACLATPPWPHCRWDIVGNYYYVKWKRDYCIRCRIESSRERRVAEAAGVVAARSAELDKRLAYRVS